MRRIYLILLLFISTSLTAQQVDKTIIVEHFTNTYCSICANKNPGFYSNLNNFPNILHIAYHPSVPYDECPFNQHNVTENDERTKYYNIFNGTPRLVIQGEVISTSQNYSSSTLFDPYTGATSSFSINSVLEQNVTKDSVILNLSVKKEDASSLTSLNLYAAIVEETINFNAQNGESVHHDVFRKSFVGSDPISIALPTTVGEAKTLRYALKYNNDWEGTELKAISILQHDDKTLEQANASNKIADFMLDINKENTKAVAIPTLFNNRLTLLLDSSQVLDIKMYDLFGKLAFETKTVNSVVNLSSANLSQGMYILIVKTKSEVYKVKVVKE
jgi:hypothetical protein